MSATSIEWTDETWNPVTGCRKISPGCTHCYAETIAKRFWKARAFTDVRTHADRLDAPLHWRKPRMVFVNSMSDLFHEDVPDAFIDEVFAVMALCPQHTFQVLTKRPERMREYFDVLRDSWPRDRVDSIGAAMNAIRGRPERQPVPVFLPLPGVWLGVSVEDQTRVDERIPLLLATPAAVRFVSAEPLLGPVDLSSVGPLRWDVLTGWKPAHDGWPEGANTDRLDWLIVGGESGASARPMHPDWARSLRDQCQTAGVPFFFKQWGEWAPYRIVPGGDLGGDARAGRATIVARTGEPNDGHFRKARGDVWMGRVGKRVAGRLLDDREWSEFPE